MVLNNDVESVVSRQLTGKISKRRNHSTQPLHEGQVTDQTEEAKAACSQCASAVGFKEEADELGHALETWTLRLNTR